MALNKLFPCRMYDFQAVERYGDVSQIKCSNQFLFLELAPFGKNLQLRNEAMEAIDSWKHMCRRRRRPYVVAEGRLKPTLIRDHEASEDARLITHLIAGSPHQEENLYNLSDMSGMRVDQVQAILAHGLSCRPPKYEEVVRHINGQLRTFYRLAIHGEYSKHYYEAGEKVKFHRRPIDTLVAPMVCGFFRDADY